MRSYGSPLKLRFALRALALVTARKVTVHGLSHIESLPQDTPIIAATSHATDADVPFSAYAIASIRNVIITNQSTHYRFSQDPLSYIALHIGGRKNFLPISYDPVVHQRPTPRFNINDFDPMAAAIHRGKDIVIAAHNTSVHNGLERHGYGAVYLANRTGAPIIPIGVQVDIDHASSIHMADHPIRTVLHRPAITIRIGEPLPFEPLANIDEFSRILRDTPRDQLTPSQQSFVLQTFTAMGQQSDRVLRTIASLMPPPNRGHYRDIETL